MLDPKMIPTLDAISEVIKEIESDYSQKFAALQAEFKSAIESIKSGEDGRDGKDGQDGKDRFVVSAMPITDGEKVEKNVVVSHRGGLFTTDRKANGTPDQDPGAYTCLVNGINGVEITQVDERKFAISVEMSDGLKVSQEFKFAVPLFKGAFSKDATYEKGDVIIKDSKTLISTGDEWKMFVFPAKGDKGEKGDRGEPGQSYVDALAQQILEAK